MSNLPQEVCIECQQKGYKVDTATVKALVAVSLRQVQDTTYRFCAQKDCLVVYFNVEHMQIFTTEQIRERVYQKEPNNDDVLICYCFYHTIADVRADIHKHKNSQIIEDINTGIKSEQCACDWRNPQGNCCLGNVLKLVKQIKSKNAEDM